MWRDLWLKLKKPNLALTYCNISLLSEGIAVPHHFQTKWLLNGYQFVWCVINWTVSKQSFCDSKTRSLYLLFASSKLPLTVLSCDIAPHALKIIVKLVLASFRHPFSLGDLYYSGAFTIIADGGLTHSATSGTFDGRSRMGSWRANAVVPEMNKAARYISTLRNNLLRRSWCHNAFRFCAPQKAVSPPADHWAPFTTCMHPLSKVRKRKQKQQGRLGERYQSTKLPLTLIAFPPPFGWLLLTSARPFLSLSTSVPLFRFTS